MNHRSAIGADEVENAMKDLLAKAIKSGLMIRFCGKYRVSYNDEKGCFQYWDFGYFNLSDDDLNHCQVV